MLAADITSMAATDVGRPSWREDPIEVTFKAGQGGYFLVRDQESTSSNVERTSWTHKFYDLDQDSRGYFTSLSMGAEELEREGLEPVWLTAANEEGLSFAGWYYMDGNAPALVSDLKEIYGDVVLEGQWYDPDEIRGDLAEAGKVKAIGLDGRTLTVDEAEADEDARELLESVLVGLGLENAGEEFWAMEMDISGEGKAVTITAAIPESRLDPESPMTAVYEDYGGDMDVIPADTGREKNGYGLTFTVSGKGTVYVANTRELPPDAAVQAEKKGAAEARLTAQGEYGDNLVWNLDELGTLTISGRGEMEEAPGWADYPWRANSYIDKVKKLVIETGVTTIATNAFYNCSSLTEAEIGDTVTAIKEFAFSGCDGLTTVHMPDSITDIDPNAFYQCGNLEEGTLVGKGVYEEKFRWEMTGGGTLTLSGEGVLPGNSPWYQVTGGRDLVRVIIEKGITGMGVRSFSRNEHLVKVELPDGFLSIGEKAFYGCLVVLSDCSVVLLYN